MSSRLMKSVRSKRGLTYGVSSRLVSYREAGSFQVVFQTRAGAARRAVSLCIEEMNRMKREPVGLQELETAKGQLAGSLPLRLDSLDGLARFYSAVEYYALGRDYASRYPDLVRRVTRQGVLQSARDFLHPQKCIASIVGNLETLKGSAP
ncbi:MAG: M16 family metallopeptidase [Desulfatiglandales bacterium]